LPDGATVQKDGSISLPYTETTVDGYNLETIDSMTHTAGGHVHWDINVNETKFIKGYKETFIVGHKTDIVEGDETKLIHGNSTSTIKGWKSEKIFGLSTPQTYGGKQEFVTPWESKEVVGFSTTVIAVNKNELIGGFAFKKHVGWKRETGPANYETELEKKEKAVKKDEEIAKLKTTISAICDEKIAAYNLKITGEMTTKIANLKDDVDYWKIASTELTAKINSRLELDSSGDIKIIAGSKLELVGGTVKVNADSIALNDNVLKIS
jgi:hypothetical protein